MNIAVEIKCVAEKYAKHGITEQEILQHIENGKAEGFDEKTALTGVRLALAVAFGEHEYFTSCEISKALGCTVDEVNKHIEEHKAELLQRGELVSINPMLLQMLEEGCN